MASMTHRTGVLTAFALVVQAASCATEPASSTLRQVATLRTARAAHTATTLPSGQVPIAGGMTESGGGIASLELFDPVRDGDVLITGGYTDLNRNADGVWRLAAR